MTVHTGSRSTLDVCNLGRCVINNDHEYVPPPKIMVKNVQSLPGSTEKPLRLYTTEIFYVQSVWNEMVPLPIILVLVTVMA